MRSGRKLRTLGKRLYVAKRANKITEEEKNCAPEKLGVTDPRVEGRISPRQTRAER